MFSPVPEFQSLSSGLSVIDLQNKVFQTKQPKLLETARKFPTSTQLLLPFRQVGKVEILATTTLP